jgi:lipoprotein-releasing system ATP-binding protein
MDVPVEAGQPAASEFVRGTNIRKVFRSGEQEIVPLDAIDFTISRGEMIAIVGPSGAGKSTFLHALAALDTLTSGALYFAGKPLQSFGETELAEYRNRKVGFIWQRHYLLPDFTASENVAMPLLVRGISLGQALQAANDWLGEVGLAGRAEQRAGNLSGGEQQRVAIARALVNEPSLLLADEPTGDLDERNAENIFTLMQRLHHSHHLTSIIATHNLNLARRCDRVLQLEHGKLAPCGDLPAVSAATLSRNAGTGARAPEQLG